MQVRKIKRIRVLEREGNARLLNLDCGHNPRIISAEVTPSGVLSANGINHTSELLKVGDDWTCVDCPTKAAEGVTLAVVRRFFSFVPPGEFWERIPYERVVWKRDPSGEVTVTDDEPLDGYCRGLLVPFIDGRGVTLPEFDDAMTALNLSRAWVLPAIEEMNAKRAAETRKAEPEPR